MANFLVSLGLFFASLHSAAAASLKQPSAASSQALPAYGFLSKSTSDVGEAASSILSLQGGLDEMNSALHEEYKRWVFKKDNLAADQKHLQGEINDLETTLTKHKQLKLELQRQEDTLRIYEDENNKLASALQQADFLHNKEKEGKEAEIKALECQLRDIPKNRQAKLQVEYNLITKLGDSTAVLQQKILGLNKEASDTKAAASTFDLESAQELSNKLKELQNVQQRINSLESELMAQAQGQLEVERAQKQVESQIKETVKQREKVLKSVAECKDKKSQKESEIQAAKQKLVDANQRFKSCQLVDATNQDLQGKLTQCKTS